MGVPVLDLSEIPVLETPRLRLRRPELRDFDAYAALCANPEVMRYVGDGLPQSRRRAWQAFSARLGHRAPRSAGQFAAQSTPPGVSPAPHLLSHPPPPPPATLHR